MRIFKRTDYQDKLLRIKPEGWLDELVFEVGFINRCGQAEAGIGIRINDEAGGVLTLDDCIAINKAIVEHLELVKTNSQIKLINKILLKLNNMIATDSKPTKSTKSRKEGTK